LEYIDYAVDLETTGTQPEHAGILQLAAVRFDYDTGEIDPGPNPMFNSAVQPLPGRLWDFGTINWWREEKGRLAHLGELMRTGRPANIVFPEFIDWIGHPSKPIRMWAKPSHFEQPFIESACKQMGITNPFHYRHCMDINSFIQGLRKTAGVEAARGELELPFEGQQHDAIFDALHDLRVLLRAREVYGK
jgi:DNA polymerase III epsilon subunit-like protein